MHVVINDYRAVNAWVRKAMEEGWKRPREIVEVAGLLDIGFEPGFGYCDVCNRAVADFDALASTKWADESEARFLARLEGAREGFVDFDEAICCGCMPNKSSKIE